MNPLALKFLSVLAVSSAVSLGVCVTMSRHSSSMDDTNERHVLSKVAVVKASANIVTASVNQDENKLNYKCQLRSAKSTSHNCIITKLSLDKNWADISTIISAPKTTDITTDDLTNPKNYFKLEVDADLYAAVNFDNKKVIDIVSEEIGNEKISSFESLFKIDGNAAEYKTATHVLAKAPSAPVSDIKDTTNGSFCLLNNSDRVSTATTATQCDLFVFGMPTSGDKYSSVTYAHTTISAASLEADKYYLLKWTPENTALLKNSLSTKTHAHIGKQPDMTSSSVAATLTQVAPVIIDGASAFILSTH